MKFILWGCARFRADLSLLQDGCLSETRRKRLLEHLARCEPCRVQRDLIHRLSHELRAANEVIPSPDFDDRVISALRTPELRRPAWVQWRRFSLAAASAAVLMTTVLQYAALEEVPDRPSAPAGSSVNVQPDQLLEQYKLDRNSPLWHHRDLPQDPDEEGSSTGTTG